MKQLIIADISSLRKGNTSFGHFISVAKNYRYLLEGVYDIRIAGGPIYKKYFSEEELVNLPNEIAVDLSKDKVSKIKEKVGELINARKLLKSTSNSVIIFQHYSVIPLLIEIIINKQRNNNIFLIQYKSELKNFLKKCLFRLARKKINGIITSQDTIGKEYKLPSIVLPDYIYVKETNQNYKNIIPKYDFGFVGIVREGKRVERIVEIFQKRNEKILIAGNFMLSEEKNKKILSGKNNHIYIYNKYLSEDEYWDSIESVKYFILPYDGKYYENASSGVIYDCLFHKKPVITIKRPTFQFIEDYGLGKLYDNDLSEINFDKLNDKNVYSKYEKNIEMWLESFNVYKRKLEEFLNE